MKTSLLLPSLFLALVTGTSAFVPQNIKGTRSIFQRVHAKQTLAASTLDTNESKSKNNDKSDKDTVSNSELTSLNVREKEMEVRNKRNIYIYKYILFTYVICANCILLKN
jgi:hypothetical protein